jgi:hypothetical protein
VQGQDEASPHLDECPICMLNFPGGLNRSSCCKQPICTECYLQVAPRMSSRGVSCPFCKKDNYTVGYFGPPSAAARAKARQEEQLALASARKEPEPARVTSETPRVPRPAPPLPSTAALPAARGQLDPRHLRRET